MPEIPRQTDGTPITRANTDEAWDNLMESRARLPEMRRTMDDLVWFAMEDANQIRDAPPSVLNAIVVLAAMAVAECSVREYEAKRGGK
jgi:hypothetical protein